MGRDTTKGTDRAFEGSLFDSWIDAIEDGVRSRVRGFIEALLEEELSEALARPRYGRRQAGEAADEPLVSGVRNGHRERNLTGTFGKTRIAVPRARLTSQDGSTQEWRSASLRVYQRRTHAADALIASACTKSSSGGSRPKPSCPARRPRPCCSGLCSPQRRSPCERSMDGRPCRRPRPITPLTSPLDRIASASPKTRHPISTQFATAPRLADPRSPTVQPAPASPGERYPPRTRDVD